MKTPVMNTLPQIVRAIQGLYAEVESIRIKMEGVPAVVVPAAEPTRGRRRKVEEDVVVSAPQAEPAE